MDVDISQLVIIPPIIVQVLNTNGSIWESYRTHAYDGPKKIAYVTTAVQVFDSTAHYDNFFFDSMRRPKPFVEFMRTNDEYKGNGIAGMLLRLTNEYYISKFGTPLNSSTKFLLNTCFDICAVPGESNSLKVWEKLVDEGLAYEYNQDGKRRFAFHDSLRMN
jgi:hypothetical protein